MDTLPYGMIVAMVSGLLGAAFFMLIQLQSRLSEGGLADIRDMWTWRLLFLRCIVGIGAASILYFFFRSGLLGGDLWPKLEAVNMDLVTQSKVAEVALLNPGTRIVPNKDFALLIIWSFLAGYSQTLVPNLLLNAEARQRPAA